MMAITIFMTFFSRVRPLLPSRPSAEPREFGNAGCNPPPALTAARESRSVPDSAVAVKALGNRANQERTEPGSDSAAAICTKTMQNLDFAASLGGSQQNVRCFVYKQGADLAARGGAQPSPPYRTRISPSCATEAISRPSWLNRLPRLKPRAPEADGLSSA